MEDPAKLIESGMEQVNQILALKASVKEGKRLLREALKQRDLAKSETERQLYCRESERAALRQVTKCFAFRFFPREVKDFVIRVLGPGL